MLHQNINQYFYGNVYYSYYFYPIAVAFVSNPSSSEDNQSSLGTDLSIINTEDEKHIDTGGSCLSHTVVKPDSHLAQIFWQNCFFPCIN